MHKTGRVTLVEWRRFLLALAWLATAWLSVVAAAETVAVSATLAGNSRTFTVSAPGISACQGSFAATIIVGGQKREISSVGGTGTGPVQNLTENTPFGAAEVSGTTFHFKQEQVDMMFRLGRLPGVAGVMAQVGIRNVGKEPVNFISATPMALEFGVSGAPGEWLVTALDQSVNEVPAVVGLSEIRNPLNVQEYGGFYRRNGEGFLFGPVGAPLAFVDAHISLGTDGKVSFRIAADMSGVQVDAGETRWGQQVVILLEPPRSALPRWAEWVAKTHGARSAKGALSGWNSWNFLGEAVTGKDVLAVADEVLRSPGRLQPGVIQIDDGYQDITERKETNDKFPEGLAYYARRIAATGARPGLYLESTGTTGAPRLLDSPGWSGLIQSIQQSVRSGFTYLKINHLNFGDMPIGKRTTFEIYRGDYAAIRKAAGEDTYLAYCDSRPSRITVGLMDASRIGADANRTARSIGGTSQADLRFAMSDVLRSYHLHGRWFAVDNDTYYMGTDSQNVSEIAGKWPLVRTWMSMVGLSCGTAITSDPLYRESFKTYWRNMEVMTPPAKERSEVLDLGTSREWPRLLGHVKRVWGDAVVVLLWNPGVTEQAITLDFVQAGMDSRHRYAVWSFWDNRFLGVVQGSWTTPSLEPMASQQLCFTDLDLASSKPVIIGSNLHIFCGAAEIERVTSRRGGMAIELTDAGARDGDLFIYSSLPLLLKSATGCAVTGVSQAGENVWRISLTERQRGMPQRLDLTVVLPVTRQAWFWVLIGLLVASLLFAVWRYWVGFRLQREHALEMERARIARDIHDDLGTSLTKVSVMADAESSQQDDLEGMRNRLAVIRAVAQEITRSMDETVWAINPRNDTLESMLRYLVDYAGEFLLSAGLRLRLDLPQQTPAWFLSSALRHDLFLAFKEALNNIVKHAAAREVHLTLSIEARQFRLIIHDDGRGLPADALEAAEADGLRNMHKRMAQLGGECRVSSTPGQGTEVAFLVPVPTIDRKITL